MNAPQNADVDCEVQHRKKQDPEEQDPVTAPPRDNAHPLVYFVRELLRRNQFRRISHRLTAHTFRTNVATVTAKTQSAIMRLRVVQPRASESRKASPIISFTASFVRKRTSSSSTRAPVAKLRSSRSS